MPRCLALLLLALAAPAGAEILFHEGFDSAPAATRFDSSAAGELAVGGGERGGVWLSRFKPGPAGEFGHRVRARPGWEFGGHLHWAGYVRFGYRDRSPEWLALEGQTYALSFPVIRLEGHDGAYLSGRFLRRGEDGFGGEFVLTTPDGREHRVPLERPLVSNRWYGIEIGVQDRGAHDVVRVWINNDDRSNPDYQFVGGDFVDARDWGPRLVFDYGRRGHGVPAEAVFYYDDITIANDFIGLPKPRPVPPAAPTNLR